MHYTCLSYTWSISLSQRHASSTSRQKGEWLHDRGFDFGDWKYVWLGHIIHFHLKRNIHSRSKAGIFEIGFWNEWWPAPHQQGISLILAVTGISPGTSVSPGLPELEFLTDGGLERLIERRGRCLIFSETSRARSFAWRLRSWTRHRSLWTLAKSNFIQGSTRKNLHQEGHCHDCRCCFYDFPLQPPALHPPCVDPSWCCSNNSNDGSGFVSLGGHQVSSSCKIVPDRIIDFISTWKRKILNRGQSWIASWWSTRSGYGLIWSRSSNVLLNLVTLPMAVAIRISQAPGRHLFPIVIRQPHSTNWRLVELSLRGSRRWMWNGRTRCEVEREGREEMGDGGSSMSLTRKEGKMQPWKEGRSI